MKNTPLFQLLRLSLGNTISVDLPIDLNWRKLFLFSCYQGVGFLILDSIRDRGDIPEAVLEQWIANSLKHEYRYKQYTDKLASLNELLRSKGVEALVMKGYGCSLNWPNPARRPTGDIDIYTPDQKLVDEIISQDLGIEVSHGDMNHSTFIYQKLKVENHHTILKVQKHSRNAELEPLLLQYAKDNSNIVDLGGCPLKLPSQRFNAIHLLFHSAEHLYTSQVTLRHIVDWSTFVSACAKKGSPIEWNWFQPICRKTKINLFLDAINSICVDYLGYPAKLFPIMKRDDKMRDRLLKACLDIGKQKTISMDNYDKFLPYFRDQVVYFSKNSWRRRLVYGESAPVAFIRMSWGHLRNHYLKR